MRSSFIVKLLVSIFVLMVSTACSTQVVSAPLVANPPTAIHATATLIPDETTPPESTSTIEPASTPEIQVCRTSLVRAVPEYNKKNLLYTFQTNDPFVVLTIDDGYSNNVLNQILDILEENDASATFFLVGTSFGGKIKRETLARLVENGNDIAYHSYSHPEVSFIEGMSYEDWLLDYQQWSDALRAAIGDELYEQGVTPYARAPYGSWTTAFMKSLDDQSFIPVYWSADEHTFEANRMPLRDGSILILHIIPENLDELEKLMETDWQVISLRKALGETCD